MRLVENDPARLSSLLLGNCSVQEPRFRELLEKHLHRKLHLNGSLNDVTSSKFVFVCVGTPSASDGSSDVSAIYSVLKYLSEASDSPQVWILKSSVPPGTTRKLCNDLNLSCDRLVVNPEFLREGHCIDDFMFPPRIVVGPCVPEVAAVVSDLFF